MKKLLLFCFTTVLCHLTFAQGTFPVNGPWDVRPGQYAFINANIVVNADQTIANGTLLIKDHLITEVGAGIAPPKGYAIIDLKGKYIYPGLIDAYAAYGITTPPPSPKRRGALIYTSTKPGAFAWNEAVKPEIRAKDLFHADAPKALELKKIGFGAVQSFLHDGIIRGTSAVVSLGEERDNELFINDNAAVNYSFSKGSAPNDYPASLMGSIALIRQTYYDAQWYKNQNAEYNISLESFNQIQNLPQIFETGDALSVLRANKIAKEFGVKYIFKTEGKEYRRIDAIKATESSFIIPLTFPKTYEITNTADAQNISYQNLKDWELAPKNPAILEKAGVKFAITSYGLDKLADFWTNLRKAIDNGLSEKQALNSLTTIPAEMLGVSNKIGSISKGKLANFIITSDNLFKKETIIYENWTNGRQLVINKIPALFLAGNYTLTSAELPNIKLKITGKPDAYSINIDRNNADSAHVSGTITQKDNLIAINFDLKNKPAGNILLNGYINNTTPITIKGDGILPDGASIKWTATFTDSIKAEPLKPNIDKKDTAFSPVIYPFIAYGSAELPKAETVLFKNATLWTNEQTGILKNTDILIENGKIKAIGKNLSAKGAREIDATGKHISPGIIDEHSHLAVEGDVNEGTQDVTSEVRIGDVLNPEDINIYRQLAGGVTTSHILHGSANPIGGQTQLIKLRWGLLPEEMKFANADGFIKFALGENVKQSNWGIPYGTPNMRFPQSRMGVEQVYIDEFTRAKEYKAARLVKGNNVRRDLELDAIVEILDNKRFITCHSYVQSEINMLMHVADSMGFKINTFTHILEGYKVADKMKAHNIAGSTFSDWWAYKMEVAEAIPYNGKIMHDVGIVTAFNSDDEEMARRLNQEAGKAVAYGHMEEEEALKLVTLNPAKMLHIDKNVGSLKVGKDADLVVWSTDPLSIYAVAEKTYVDGIAYWDIEKDAAMQRAMKADRARIIQKMANSKNNGGAVQKAPFKKAHAKDDDEAFGNSN